MYKEMSDPRIEWNVKKNQRRVHDYSATSDQHMHTYNKIIHAHTH